MSIETDLFSHLSNDAALVALVDVRIYPLLMPLDCEKPAVVYSITNNKELQALNSREPYGEEVLIQVDCWDSDFDHCLEVRDAVQNAMYSFTSKAHGFNSRSLFESETGLHRQLIEFKIKR